MKKYKSIFISDVHLGTKDCKANELVDFLKNNSCENLYLVGDIIDGWRIQQNKWKWKKSHTEVIKKLLTLSSKGTKLFFVTGNHDEFLRPIVKFNLAVGNVRIENYYEHRGVDGKKYLVIHGDMFDGISDVHKWLVLLGDGLYDFILTLNSQFNWWRHKFGFGYWSLSKFLKHKVKKAVDFIYKFEKNIADYCKKKGYDGVICGHIHHAEIKIIDGIVYMNDGDWVESLSALVEHHDGRWEIINWS